jgi:tagatose-1,6-bisphosphate aldolase
VAVIAPGKLHRLRNCSTAAGRFVILAADHRNSLRRALMPDAPDRVGYATLAGLKAELVQALSPAASAVLLDPEFGLGQCLTAGAIAPGSGLVVAVGSTGYGGSSGNRTSGLLAGWTVEKAARLGADGVKLLVHYHPEAPGAAAQEDLVARVAEDCQTHELPFFLEPLTYPLDSQHTKLPSAEKRELVVETAKRLTPLGADVLKAEFPVDPAAEESERAWATACRELTAASCVPWVLLSAGVSFESFLRQAAVACAAGASGILAGRALWAEALAMAEPDRRAFLHAVAEERLSVLRQVVDSQARPWLALFEVPRMTEGWFAAY